MYSVYITIINFTNSCVITQTVTTFQCQISKRLFLVSKKRFFFIGVTESLFNSEVNRKNIRYVLINTNISKIRIIYYINWNQFCRFILHIFINFYYDFYSLLLYFIIVTIFYSLLHYFSKAMIFWNHSDMMYPNQISKLYTHINHMECDNQKAKT